MTTLLSEKFTAGGRIALALVIAFALFVRIVSAFATPLWQGPDEPKHFEYIRMLVDKREQLWDEKRLLTLEDASLDFEGEVIASMARNNFWQYSGGTTPSPLPPSFYAIWKDASLQLHRPSLYYFLGAVVIFPLQSVDLEYQLLAVRFLSVILSTLTVVVTYFVAREVAPEDRFMPLIASFFVAALPMHIFIGGTANSDNLLTLTGSFVIFALTICLQRGPSVRRWLFVIGALVLALVAKRAAVGLIPVVLLAAIFAFFSLRRRAQLYSFGAGISVLAFGWFVTLGGEWTSGLLPLDVFRRSVIAYALNYSGQLDSLSNVPLASPEVRELIGAHQVLSFKSFWGVFGWFNLSLSDELYQVLAVVSVVFALGFFVGLCGQLWGLARSATKSRLSEILVQLVFLAAILSMIILAEGERLAYLSPGEIPQGRYLFDVITPIGIVFAMGARVLLPKRFLGSVVPTLSIIFLLVALDLFVFIDSIRPFYIGRVFN